MPIPLNLSALSKPALDRTSPDAGGRVATIDARMLVLMRCVLAFSALVTVWIDPSAIKRLVELTFNSLAIYCTFSVIVTAVSYRANWPRPERAVHWVDVFFYAYLIALSGGSSSFFYLGFFYSILVASFVWGFREGVSVTVVSLVMVTAAGLMSVPAGDQPELGHTVTRATYLFVFGYIISYLGGYEGLLRRRLALLKEINNIWHPRLGVDYVHGLHLDRLLEFYGAKSCVLVLRRATPALHYLMYCASRGKPGQSGTPSNVAESAASALLRLPDSLAAFFHDPAGSWWRRWRGYSAYDFDLGARTTSFMADCAVWATLLDAQIFVTVPYARGSTTGRLFLATDRGGFTHADIDFLSQVSDAMSTIGENIYLMEELTTKAAAQERLTISRDLHDTTIQPYIGLKLALEALHREAGPGNAISGRISEIIDMTEMTVCNLRDYARILKEKKAIPGNFLVAAVQKQTDQLRRFYGINVEVHSDISPRLKGRLAVEAFQIISEGLSNVLRHTAAKNAFVTIHCEEARVLLEIGNEVRAALNGAATFVPRSIYERAQALGGGTVVEQRSNGYTVVQVTVPYVVIRMPA